MANMQHILGGKSAHRLSARTGLRWATHRRVALRGRPTRPFLVNDKKERPEKGVMVGDLSYRGERRTRRLMRRQRRLDGGQVALTKQNELFSHLKGRSLAASSTPAKSTFLETPTYSIPMASSSASSTGQEKNRNPCLPCKKSKHRVRL